MLCVSSQSHLYNVTQIQSDKELFCSHLRGECRHLQDLSESFPRFGVLPRIFSLISEYRSHVSPLSFPPPPLLSQATLASQLCCYTSCLSSLLLSSFLTCLSYSHPSSLPSSQPPSYPGTHQTIDPQWHSIQSREGPTPPTLCKTTFQSSACFYPAVIDHLFLLQGCLRPNVWSS